MSMSGNEPSNRVRKTVERKVLRMATAGFFLLIAGSVLGADLSVLHANQAPTRLARGPGGKIYTTDPKAGSVFIYDSGLNAIGELKNLNVPLGIAVGIDGTMYVGCEGIHAVQVYDTNGDFVMNIGEGRLIKPSDIAIDLYGNLYIADSAAHRIRIYNMDGGHLGDIGSFGAENGQFDFPIAVDVAYTTNGAGQAVGELFVADQGNARFQVFDLRGNLLRVFSPGRIGDTGGWFGVALQNDEVSTLQSLAIDDQCRIHSLDVRLSRIQVWDAVTGSYIEKYGSHGTGAGFLNLPLDIVITDSVNGTNSVVVCNNNDGRIEVINELATLGDIQLSASPVAENVPTGTTVGTLSLTPAPASPVMYMLVAETWPYDNAFFAVNNGTNLVTTQPLDYEKITNMQIRVKAVGPDSQNLTLAQTVRLSVTDANEPPTDLQLSSAYVLEGHPPNTLVGTFIVFDEDPADTQTYALVSGFGDSGNAHFYIDGANLMTQTSFDHSVTNLYSIRVQGTDSGGLAVTGIFDIDIYPTNSIGEADLDGDGISDWWEANFTEVTDLDPALDTDGDGIINIDEWIAGTDPFTPTDRFEGRLSVHSGSPVLVWRGQYDRAYSVYWSTNLQASMQLIESGIGATPPWNVYTDTVHNAESKGFYRLKVEHAQ